MYKIELIDEEELKYNIYSVVESVGEDNEPVNTLQPLYTGITKKTLEFNLGQVEKSIINYEAQKEELQQIINEI